MIMESYDQRNAVWWCRPHGAVAKARAPRHSTGFLLAPVRGRDRHVCAGDCNVAPSRHGSIAVACVVALSHHGRCWPETPVGPLFQPLKKNTTLRMASHTHGPGGGHRNPVTPRGNSRSGHINSSNVPLTRNHEVPAGIFWQKHGPGPLACCIFPGPIGMCISGLSRLRGEARQHGVPSQRRLRALERVKIEPNR